MAGHFDALLRTRVVAALASPRDVDDYLRLVDPTWTVHQVRARVTEVRRERAGALSVLVRPNRVFRGFRAGQYVQLEIERAGVRHSRIFSISSAPADGPELRLSMHVMPGGKVSGWAAEAARVGELVTLSQAAGDFVLPEFVPAKLLFISAGSGVTPILAIARQLAHVTERAPHRPSVTWLHYGRTETMLEDEVRELGAAHSWLRLVLTRTEGPAAAPAELRHLSLTALQTHVASWTDHETFACGPAALLQTARAAFREHGVLHRLHTESFGAAWPVAPVDHTALRSRVVFAKSGREISAVAGASLLEQAERAGLHPQHGCRMGICHTCKCTKLSGAVRNARTGVVSDAPNEEIRLCISMPRSDVTLDL